MHICVCMRVRVNTLMYTRMRTCAYMRGVSEWNDNIWTKWILLERGSQDDDSRYKYVVINSVIVHSATSYIYVYDWISHINVILYFDIWQFRNSTNAIYGSGVSRKIRRIHLLLIFSSVFLSVLSQAYGISQHDWISF